MAVVGESVFLREGSLSADERPNKRGVYLEKGKLQGIFAIAQEQAHDEQGPPADCTVESASFGAGRQAARQAVKQNLISV